MIYLRDFSFAKLMICNDLSWQFFLVNVVHKNKKLHKKKVVAIQVVHPYFKLKSWPLKDNQNKKKHSHALYTKLGGFLLLIGCFDCAMKFNMHYSLDAHATWLCYYLLLMCQEKKASQRIIIAKPTKQEKKLEEAKLEKESIKCIWRRRNNFCNGIQNNGRSWRRAKIYLLSTQIDHRQPQIFESLSPCLLLLLNNAGKTNVQQPKTLWREKIKQCAFSYII